MGWKERVGASLVALAAVGCNTEPGDSLPYSNVTVVGIDSLVNYPSNFVGKRVQARGYSRGETRREVGPNPCPAERPVPIRKIVGTDRNMSTSSSVLVVDYCVQEGTALYTPERVDVRPVWILGVVEEQPINSPKTKHVFVAERVR